MKSATFIRRNKKSPFILPYKLFLILSCLLIILTVYQVKQSQKSAVNAQVSGSMPQLKTSGNKIVTYNTGKEVILRGVNEMANEWNLNMTFTRGAIPHLNSNWKANVIMRGFASDPVKDPNFTWTSSWGQVVTHANYMSWLDETVQLARDNKQYIIFAWRSTGINGPQPTMPDDGAQQALAVLADRYSKPSSPKYSPNVILALQVEPHDVTWTTLKPRFNSMITAIRNASTVANQPMIMVPGTSWGRDVSHAINDPVTGANIVYKSHPYGKQNATCGNQFDAWFGKTHSAGIPVFIGEFGDQGSSICYENNMTDIRYLFDYMNTRGISWTAWAFNSGGNPSLISENTNFTPTSPYGVETRAQTLTNLPLPEDSGTITPTPKTTTPTPIQADTTKPTVIITAPYNGAGIASDSIVTITANASDNVRVTKVEFSVDNTLKCTDTTVTYSCNWTVPSTRNINYTLKTVAYDAARNSSTATVTVTVR